jgi:hypothetical protein
LASPSAQMISVALGSSEMMRGACNMEHLTGA